MFPFTSYNLRGNYYTQGSKIFRIFAPFDIPKRFSLYEERFLKAWILWLQIEERIEFNRKYKKGQESDK
jgi:hypothetical protein